MKTWKTWAIGSLVLLGLLATLHGKEERPAIGSGKVESGFSQQSPSPESRTEEPPAPTEPPNPISQHWQGLQPILTDYNTQRVNQVLLAAQQTAMQTGKQPLQVVKEWQQGLANNYAYEVLNGSGEESQRLRQEYFTRYTYSVIAETVLTNGQPMQTVNINENAVICAMRSHVGEQLAKGVICGEQ